MKESVYKIVNATGHPLELTDGFFAERWQSRIQARVTGNMRPVEQLELEDGNGYRFYIPLLEVTEERFISMPSPEPGVLYVVSGVVAAKAALEGRTDCVTPSRRERTNGGRVSAARALLRIRK